MSTRVTHIAQQAKVARFFPWPVSSLQVSFLLLQPLLFLISSVFYFLSVVRVVDLPCKGNLHSRHCCHKHNATATWPAPDKGAFIDMHAWQGGHDVLAAIDQPMASSSIPTYQGKSKSHDFGRFHARLQHPSSEQSRSRHLALSICDPLSWSIGLSTMSV